MGTKIIAAINITFKVKWLDAASQRVKLLFGLVIDGNTNGNNENAAVLMIAVIVRLLQANAKPERRTFTSNSVSKPITNPATGAAIIQL